METLRVVLLDAQKLVRDVDGQVTPLMGGAKETLASAKDTLTAARSALGQARSPWDADRRRHTGAETGRQDPGRHDRLDGPRFRRAH